MKKTIIMLALAIVAVAAKAQPKTAPVKADTTKHVQPPPVYVANPNRVFTVLLTGTSLQLRSAAFTLAQGVPQINETDFNLITRTQIKKDAGDINKQLQDAIIAEEARAKQKFTDSVTMAAKALKPKK